MCFKRRHSVPTVFLTSPRGRIRHVVFVCSSHRDTYFHFIISHWLLSLRSVLSVCHISINHLLWKWVAFFPARNCKELPSSWSGVTSFPVKTLNCHIYRSIYTPKIARIHQRELWVFGPYLCPLIQPRPRGEEGNCSYILPLSHRVIRESEKWWFLFKTIPKRCFDVITIMILFC